MRAIARSAGGMAMSVKSLFDCILHDEAWTQRLGDAEARLLVEWLVEQAEQLASEGSSLEVDLALRRLCRRGRVLACFVSLWCQDNARAGAVQLAACEGLSRALPSGEVDPCELMLELLEQETRTLARAA